MALGGTALSPATGLMGVVVGVIAAWRRGSCAWCCWPRLLNLPWIVAGLLQPTSGRVRSRGRRPVRCAVRGPLRPARVGTHAGRHLELRSGPHLPDTGYRGAVCRRDRGEIAARHRGAVTADRRLLAVLVVIGGVGLVVALAGWLVPDLVGTIWRRPGGGIIRDGTRWLALLVPLRGRGVRRRRGCVVPMRARVVARARMPCWACSADHRAARPGLGRGRQA